MSICTYASYVVTVLCQHKYVHPCADHRICMYRYMYYADHTSAWDAYPSPKHTSTSKLKNDFYLLQCNAFSIRFGRYMRIIDELHV